MEAGSGGSSPKGPSGGQTKRGASRGGGEGLVVGEHVPDRFGELSGDVDLSDLGATLAAQAALVALVALAIGRVAQGVHGGFEHRPAQVLRALFGQRAAAVAITGLIDAWAEPRVAAKLLRRGEPADVADLRGDRERQHPTDPRNGQQQRHVGMVRHRRSADRG